MEYINGDFIMAGCDHSQALHTLYDARPLIHTIGFLPLFSNTIPGFSLEEHTTASSWWTDDPDTDPWAWRMTLAADESIAYGKFFGRNAGFISKQWFPTFANYRRNGYDFDALFEDELASYRSKKIMDVFELDDESVGQQIMSSEVKVRAGFGKDGGEKNFEGVITDLQMQTYLIMADFQQKKNKKGVAYGWHIAVMETPETKWGREYVTSEYSSDPQASWKRIVENMKQFYPEAEESQILKLLGIKYPGGVENKATKTATPRKTTEKKIRTADLDWPENLLRAMEAAAVKAEEKRKERAAEAAEAGMKTIPDVDTPPFTLPEHLNSDQMAGLTQAISTLNDNEKKVIHLRFEEQRTIKDTATEFGLTGSRIQQITAKALRKLRHPARLALIVDGLEGVQEVEELRKLEAREAVESGDRDRVFSTITIYDLKLSVRATNCLVRAGMYTLADVVKLADEDPVKMLQIRNLGKNSLLEVIEKLEEYGVDCYEVRKACGFGIERREDVAELQPSVRLYNILIRNGLDTVSKVEEIIKQDPMALLRLDGMGRKTLEELVGKLEEVGVDCDSVKKETEWLGWR